MTSWLSLVPGDLPWRCLHVEAAPVDVARALAGLALAPLEPCPRGPGARADARVHASASAARAAHAGQNHFGTYVSLSLLDDAIEIELFGEPEGFEAELAVVTRVLARVFAAPSRAKWTAFSYEMGSGHRSELRDGDATELLPLVGA